MAVNYIEEREAFYGWLTMNHLSANAQSLWNALFTICNKQRWPDGFFKVPTMTLLSYTHCSHDALLDARQQLKNKGLIDFIKGNRRTDAAAYKLIFLTSVNRDFCPEIADKPAGKAADKEADKPAGKAADKEADKPADVYKHNINIDKTTNKTVEDAASARAGFDLPFATDQDASAYHDNMTSIDKLAKRIGLPREPFDYDKAESLMADYGIEWVTQAMIRTGSRAEKARSWGYVEGILRNWRKKGSMDDPATPLQAPVGKRVTEQQYSQRQYGEIDLNQVAAKMVAEAAAQKEPATP